MKGGEVRQKTIITYFFGGYNFYARFSVTFPISSRLLFLALSNTIHARRVFLITFSLPFVWGKLWHVEQAQELILWKKIYVSSHFLHITIYERNDCVHLPIQPLPSLSASFTPFAIKQKKTRWKWKYHRQHIAHKSKSKKHFQFRLRGLPCF